MDGDGQISTTTIIGQPLEGIIEDTQLRKSYQ